MKHLIVILTLILSFQMFGQKQQKDTTEINAFRNNIFLELYGLGYGYSLNYERLYPLKKEKFTLTSRIGFSYVYLKTNLYHIEYLTIPASSSLLIGKKEHKIEMGTGISFINFPTYQKDDGLIGTIILGYRLQPIKERVTIRIHYSPLFLSSFSGKNEGWVQMGGFSFGYTF